MATVTTLLKMTDQFSRPLQRISNQVQSTVTSLERMRKIIERPIGAVKVSINSSQAMSEASALAGKISSRIGKIKAGVELKVNAKLSGAMSGLESGMDRLRMEIEKLNTSLKNASQNQSLSSQNQNPGSGDDGGATAFEMPTGMINTLAGWFGSIVGGAAEQQAVRGNLQAQIGLDTSQADAAMKSIDATFTSGWGESLASVAGDFALVRQNIQGLSNEASASYLKSAYAVERISNGKTEIGEISKTTRTLMTNFAGLEQTAALDLIATGFQRGGNYADDLMDTINEYAVHFAGLGMSAEQMFATLIAGSQQGAWNLDKVGDAVKESFIQMQSMSKDSSDAYKMLGMDANKMAAQIAAGGDAANQAYQATLLAIGNVDSAVQRNQIGVALFGTQWEDLKDKVILAMREGQKGLEGFEGATARAAESVESTFSFQLEALRRKFAEAFAGSGQEALNSLTPLILILNEAFESGKFKPFFDGLSGAVSSVSNLLTGLVYNAMWLYGVISSNWSYIEPVIWGIIAALGLWKGAIIANNIVMGVQNGLQAISAARGALAMGATLSQAAATAAATGVQWGFNAALLASPITWIVLAVIALIAIYIILARYIINLWNTNDQFAAGIMRIWNSILNFFDKIPAYFWQLAEWMLTPFKLWASTVGKLYDVVINGIIKGIKTVLELVNEITGKSYDIQAEFSFEKVAEDALNFVGAKKDEAYAAAAENAAMREQKVLDMLNDRANKRAMEEAEKSAQTEDPGKTFSSDQSMPEGPKGTNIDSIGTVGAVNEIKDKVDISSEDLKIMRELAEMKNIQNFVTLEPSYNFGDTHVRNEGDIETLILRLNDRLQQDIASSANTAYGW